MTLSTSGRCFFREGQRHDRLVTTFLEAELQERAADRFGRDQTLELGDDLLVGRIDRRDPVGVNLT
jgi:hypothetical protein